MARVLELEEEIERDVDGVGDVLFSRLGEPVPLTSPPSPFDLSAPPRNPIAISFSARLLFVAMSQGFMVAETPEVIRMAKEIKEKGKGPSVLDSCFLDVKIGKISILALSVDSQWLAAVVGCDVRFYSIENLRNKDSTVSFPCSIKSGVVKDFKWQKNTGNIFAVLSSDGSLLLGHLQAPLKGVMNDVDAVDWSENGAFIAVARKNTLSIWSLDLKEQCQMKLLFQSWSDGTDSECSIKVDSVNWLRNNSIVIGCLRVYEDGKEEGYLVQVIAVGELEFTERSSKPVVFSFPDLFEDISDVLLPAGCGPYLFASYLKHFGLTLTSFKRAIGAHLLLLRWSLDDDRREAVSLEYENEIYTPRIDLQENGGDNLILGLVVDQAPSNEKVRVKIEAEFKEVFPNCTVWCLTSEGKLILFHILRPSDDSYTPETSSAEDYKGVAERTSAALSLKHQLPAVTLGLNDIIEVKESEPLQGLEKVSNGNDIVLAGKEVQGSANSNAQLYSGRRLNTEKLPVVSSCMQDPGSMLAIKAKTCIEELTSCPPGQTVSTTLPSEAFTTMQVGTRALGHNVAKELAGSTGSQGASFGSQSTGKLVSTNNSSAKSSSSALDRSVLGNTHGSAKIGSENKLPYSQHGPIADGSLPGGKPFSWKVSSSLSPPSVFSENKAIHSEGAKSFLVKKGSPEPLPAMHRPLPIIPQSSMPGKSLNSVTQLSLNNSRNPRSPWMAEPEPELSKRFYNVKDMAKELDKLLSFIEREGGSRDACTISQESSLSTLEDGLQHLSMMSQVHKNKIEKQLLEIQQLQNKMLQVSTRQIYMERLVKQASNDQYWDIWKRQKLSPELELKRQHILDTYQCLTNQLIGLERHFNNLEISKFGENDGVHAGRRVLHANADPSRNAQSVQKMYNTLNSQLAAAEQLSNCLSEQMAMLNINKPSVRRPTVVKELFESIGLPQEAGIFHSPESIKRNSVSASITKDNCKIHTSSTSKVLESGTARRRYSLDKSLSKFEPQKTTVKRTLKESAVSVMADKHVGRSREAFHSQTASSAIDPQKSNETHASSFSQPSLLKLHALAYPTGKGIREKPPKEASEPQLISPFKWTMELSGSSQNLKSNSHPDHPLSSSSPTVLYNNPHGIADGKFQLPDSSSNVATHTASQSGSSMVSKTASSSKRMSNVLFNASPQTSVTFSSSCAPNFKTTLPSEITHEKTSGQLSQQSGKDAPTNLSVRSSGNLGVSEKGLFSLSDESNHSLQSVVQSVDGNRIAQLDVLTGHSGSPETLSTTPFNSLASASTPVFSTKQSSTSLMSSHGLASISPIFPSLSINSSVSISSTYLPSSAMASIGKSSFDTKPVIDTNKTIPVPSSVLTPSTPPRLPSSDPLTVQSHESPIPRPSAIPFENAVLHSPPLQANLAKSNSESAPLPASKSEGLLRPTDINPLSKPAVSQALAIKVSAGLSEGEPSVIPTAGFSTFPPTSCPPQIQSTTISPLSTIPQEKDVGIDLSSSQEDEMEEEAPSMTNEFLGGLGGFGLGTASPHIPKSNPFGVSFNTTPASAPFSLTTSPGEVFRPASFSIPPPKAIELSQPTQSGATSSGFGGGFSGFGQPANMGAGQQALGSVLGAFGQSRQIGAGVQGAAGGFAGVPPGGGFAGAATGGFAAVATGGFAGAATGGGFAGAVTGGGFAAAAAGGGFAAVGSKGGGFAAAASGGSGGFGGANPGGGFAGGGFGAFSSNKSGGFSGFGGNNAAGAGGPPSQLFTQMRK
ncbi:putative transcription factor WD40-like family [Dioscorea sansibarensis]